MSGYLQQLARQALGHRQPGQPRPLPRPQAARHDGEPPGPLEETVTTAATPAAVMAPTPSAAPRGQRATATPAPERLQAVVEPAIKTRTEVQAAPLAAVSGTMPAPLPFTRERLERIEFVQPPSPATPKLPAETAMTTPGHEAAADRAEAAPATLRPQPQVPAAPRPAAASTIARAHESAPEPATAAPDVHIHIGRIELTALQQAAAPRSPRRTAAKPAMSLEDYLRQRDTRRS